MRTLMGLRMGALLMAIVLASPLAHADANTVKAKQLFEEGVTNYNLGHYEQALTAFDMAYRIRHDAAFLFNIAQCQRNLRRYDDAERSYRTYLRESPDLPTNTQDQVRKLVAEMQRAIELQQTKQQVIEPQPSGARTEARPAQAAMPMPNPPPAAATIPTNERAGRTLKFAGIGVAAFGVASIVAGGAFYAVAKSANDSVNRPSDGFYSHSAEDRRNTFQTLDVAAFAVGGVAIATGAIMYVVGRGESRRMSVNASATARHVSALSFNF